jgi:hypothetical protein
MGAILAVHAVFRPRCRPPRFLSTVCRTAEYVRAARAENTACDPPGYQCGTARKSPRLTELTFI